MIDEQRRTMRALQLISWKTPPEIRVVGRSVLRSLPFVK
jgi:hypothetical protein